MLEQLAKAIEQQDLETATQLFLKLKEQDPENPWIHLYQARLDEIRGDKEAADRSYREILRQTNNLKILSQAREGVQRLANIEKELVESAKAKAKAQPGGEELGILVLEPISNEQKNDLVSEFARIVQLDVYSARLKLPTRSWRLYRTGSMGELEYYTSSLKGVGIPCFCATVKEIGQIKVYQVKYFLSSTPGAIVLCEDAGEKTERLSFDWSEVNRQVEGLLPLFEACVDTDIHGKLQRKIKTGDYAQFRDLHLPERKMILRLCDRNYEFQHGIDLSPESESNELNQYQTTRGNWNNLTSFLKQRLPQVISCSDFTAFAETALDFSEMLKHVEPHIKLFRREESPWDAAFQLYSGLVFLRGT